jgi:hypothetical protein
MKAAKVRLIITAVLFLAWVGYLVFLAATTTRPVVLSRPQFLAADLYLVAELQDGSTVPDPRFRAEVPALLAAPTGGFPAAVPWGAMLLAATPPESTGPAETVTVREVVWGSAGVKPGETLTVRNLRECGPKDAKDPGFGWQGPGVYILPLSHAPHRGWYVTPLQRTPGFAGPAPNPRTLLLPARIYLATPQALSHLRALEAEYHPD